MTRRLEWQDKTKIIDLFFPTKKNFQSVRVILFLISPPPPKTVSASKKSFAADQSIYFCRKREASPYSWYVLTLADFNPSSLLIAVLRQDDAETGSFYVCGHLGRSVLLYTHVVRDLAKSGQSLWSKKRWTQRTTDFHYPLCSMDLLTGTDHDLVQLAIY